MDNSLLKRRDSAVDVIRITALFTVVSVHFFLYNGFYSTRYGSVGPIESIVNAISYGSANQLHGLYMFIMFGMRTFFGVCVPLFIIMTGYLMSKKTLSRSYYKGIRKTLIVFVLASVLCFLFRALYLDQTVNQALVSGDIAGVFEAFASSQKLDLKHFFFGIFDFTHANYAWYVEMYIGLFLIAPFLNLAYNKLKTQRRKQVLVLTFVFISILPSAFNIFNFDTASWWLHPSENDTYQKLIPAFWVGIYPITYYFTGMYLREFGLRPKKKSLVAMLFIFLLLFTAFNIYRCDGNGFKAGSYGNWSGIFPYILSVLLFEILRRTDSSGWKPGARLALCKIADLVLGAYLMSYVTDTMIYDVLKENTVDLFDRFPYFFITVPLSFLLSLALSFVLNLLYKGVMKLYEKIKSFVVSQRAKDTGYMWQDILFYALFVIIVFVMLWKHVYGLGGDDEAFCLTIPHRLLQGDAFFADEWHLTQLSGFLLLPFTWIYTTVFNTTEGIILAARVCYILVHGLISVVIYTRLRKYGYIGAVGVLLYFLFTPFDMMTLSYAGLGLDLVVLTGVLLATADYNKKLCLIFSGVTFAAAVLCCPYLAVGYVLFGICVAVHAVLNKKDGESALKSRIFAPKTFLWFTVGAGALAAVFAVFLFSRVSIADIFKNLPYMLQDPEHLDVSFFGKIGSYFSNIYECHDAFRYLIYAYAVMMAVMIVDKNRRRHRSLYLIVSAAISIINVIIFLPELATENYNAVMFPMLYVSVTSYVLCENKPRELFVGLFCLGLLYSVCFHTVSNRGFDVISVALAASNLAGFMFLSQLIREMCACPDNISYALWVKRMSFVLVAFLIVLQGGSQMSAKTRHVFSESEPKQLTYEISDGPAKGVKTSSENYNSYYNLYNDLMVYQTGERDNILFLTDNTYPYLIVGDYPYGTYSAWLSGENDVTVSRLRDYFKLNPEKIPRYIYIPKNSGFDIQSILNEAQANGYSIQLTNYSYQLEKMR